MIIGCLRCSSFALQLTFRRMFLASLVSGLHGEQSIEILTPKFPKSGKVVVTGRTVGVWDGGKGAIIAK